MAQIRLTRLDKRRLRKHASPNVSVLDLKKKFNIAANYDRIRAFLAGNDLPYKLRNGPQDRIRKYSTKEGFFNVDQHETWIA